MNVELHWSGVTVAAGDQRRLHVEQLGLQGPGLVLVVGPTGSGKSTLLRTVAGPAAFDDAVGLTGEVNRRPLGAGIGFLPQDPLDAFVSFTPFQELATRHRAAGRSRKDAEAAALATLERLALLRRRDVELARLSAGEAARLAFEAIQTHRPPLLILDEPGSHLDAQERRRLEEEVAATAQTRLILLATHEAKPWLAHAVKVLFLRDGRIEHALPTPLTDASLLDALKTPAPPAMPPPGDEAIIDVQDLEHAYGDTVAVRLDRLRLGTGLHALTGDNGTGKSTLLRLLAGLEAPTRGRVHVYGEAPHQLGDVDRCRRIVYQEESPKHAFFAPDVEREILYQVHNQRQPGCDVRARLREVSFDFQVDHLLLRSPFSLSGGEQERVALASSDAARSPVILLDEPTHALDHEGRLALYQFLHRAARDSCIVIATHDEHLAQAAATRTHLVPPMMEALPRSR